MESIHRFVFPEINFTKFLQKVKSAPICTTYGRRRKIQIFLRSNFTIVINCSPSKIHIFRFGLKNEKVVSSHRGSEYPRWNIEAISQIDACVRVRNFGIILFKWGSTVCVKCYFRSFKSICQLKCRLKRGGKIKKEICEKKKYLLKSC